MVGFFLFVQNVVNFFFRGYVFMIVWNWFPHTILNAPSLTMASSLGLLVTIMFFKPIVLKTRKENERLKQEVTNEERFGNALTITLVHATILIIAWLISLFI